MAMTFRANARSVRASLRSAIAAEKAVSHAVSISELELRPWVFVHILPGTKGYEDPGGNPFASVIFEIANYGRVPAIIENCVAGATIGKKPEGLLRDQHHDVIAPGNRKKGEELFPGNIEYGAVYSFLGNEDEPVFIPEVTQGEHVTFYISIRYQGIAPEQFYKTVCCWRWDFGVHYWVRYNDSEYNYRT
jgi:hypothetical protein